MQTIVPKTKIAITPEKPEVILTRVFNAPRDLVFKVCTDPIHKAVWWRCKTVTNISVQMDVKPGGLWRIVQRQEDGKLFVFHGEYIEVISPEKLVNTFEFDGRPGHVILETATFEDVDGKTKLTIKSLFHTMEDRDGMVKAGMESGSTESMDLFEEILEKLKPAKTK